MRSYLFKDLKAAGVPFTRKHVTHMEKIGTFPQRFVVGEKTVMWVAEEVDAWVEQRVRARPVVPMTPQTSASRAAAKNLPVRRRRADLADQAPAARAAAGTGK